MTRTPEPMISYAEDTGPPALLIAGGTAGDAEAAVALLGGRIVAHAGWDEVTSALADRAVRPVLMLETEGVDDALLAAGLARVDAHASALDLHVVVALDETQIDLVAAHLLGGRVQLLCAPAIPERVAALAVASQASGGLVLSDTWRESEAVRLQRLNEEVARIAEILAQLTRTEAARPGREIEDRRRSYDAGPVADEPTDPHDVRRIIRTRRLRDQFFAAGLFEDPAWDMLLDLYAAELERTRVSVSSLCIAAAVAPTTALRWIAKMTETGLFVRQPDPLDRRRAFMALSDRASDAMHGYMAAARRAELGVA